MMRRAVIPITSVLQTKYCKIAIVDTLDDDELPPNQLLLIKTANSSLIDIASIHNLSVGCVLYQLKLM